MISVLLSMALASVGTILGQGPVQSNPADAPSGVMGSSLRPDPWSDAIRQVWETEHEKLLEIARDLPEALFSARPHADSRTAVEELRHVTVGIEMATAELLQAPFDYARRVEVDRQKADTRESLVDDMSAALRTSLEAIDAHGASPSMVWWLTHQGEHYGKLVSLYRMNGMVPPASRQEGAGATVASPALTDEGSASVVYLVRHAETADGGTAPTDPPLSPAGIQRAHYLRDMLADVWLTSVHTTDYRRTRATAMPSAAASGLTVSVYDPFDRQSAASLVDALRSPGRHLVVGHSNTTPALVAALGGDPVSEISEREYDRLYIVVPAGEPASATSTLLRYGPSGEGASRSPQAR